MINITGNSRICWLGDSTVHHGICIDELSRYLSQNISFYNCGVGGTMACQAEERLFDDVMMFHPTHTFITFGANEVLTLLNEKTDIKNLSEEGAECFEIYRKSLTKIIRHLKEFSIIPVLVTPYPYDDTSISDIEINPYANEGLKLCSQVMHSTAYDEKCGIIDLNLKFAEVKKLWDAKNIRIYNDRVHPNEVGYRIGARIVLRELGYGVEIPESPETYFPYPETEKSKRRFKAEEVFRDIQFIKWGIFAYNKGFGETENVEKLLQMLNNESTADWLKRSIQNYLKYKDNREFVREEYIKRCVDSSAEEKHN